MSFGWIDAENFSFNTLLLMDRWIFNAIAVNQHPDFRENLSIALAGNPAVLWYVINKLSFTHIFKSETRYCRITKYIKVYSYLCKIG